MKSPIILRTNHDLVVEKFKKEATTFLGELRGANEALSKLENRNCQLHTRLIATDDKVEKLEVENKNLLDLLEEANTVVGDLMKSSSEEIRLLMNKIQVLEKEKQEAKFCAGTAKTVIEKLNKKLEINTEAKRQIRDLVAYKDNTGKAMKTEQGNWVHEKIDGKKVWDLTMLIGE